MVPLRITDLKLAQRWPNHLIIHHTAEGPMAGVGEFKFDTPKAQSPGYEKYSYKVKKSKTTGYHFIVEKLKEDYSVILSQPLMTLAEWEDLDPEYHRDIHIGLMGNYDMDIPTNRLYKVLAFRLLSPLMRLFLMKEDSILFHNTISNNKDCTCPGEFVDMDKLKMALRSVLRRKPVARR